MIDVTMAVSVTGSSVRVYINMGEWSDLMGPPGIPAIRHHRYFTGQAQVASLFEAGLSFKTARRQHGSWMHVCVEEDKYGAGRLFMRADTWPYRLPIRVLLDDPSNSSTSPNAP